MAYIGRQPTVGNFQICDAISTVNNQAAYTMQVGSVNVIPESANHMIVSLNGVIQKPNSSFTVSNSVITFASNLVTGDVINFIQILGNVLDLGVPSDGTVSTAKIVDGAVTSAKMFSGFKNGITEADKFRLTTTLSGASDGTVFTSNLERSDDATFAKIGTGMSESSGVFTYPTTGLYKVIWNFIVYTSSDAAVNLFIAVSSNSGSAYDQVARGFQGVSGSLAVYNTGTVSTYVNVTNSSTFRTKFEISSVSNTTNFAGNTTYDTNSLEFIRLGDSQ